MRLVVFNGSGRGRNSNTLRLLKPFLAAFAAGGHHTYSIINIQEGYPEERLRELYLSSDATLISCPLYIDGITSQTKSFIEALNPLRGGANNPPIGFHIHAAFPEPESMTVLARYSKRLCELLNARWLGALVGGASEAIRDLPLVTLLTTPYFLFMRKWGVHLRKSGDLGGAIQTFVPYPLPAHRIYLAVLMFIGQFFYLRGMHRRHGKSPAEVAARPYQS